jgi:hypothetical protein
MARGTTTTIDLTGPFFQYDPVKRYAANVIDMLEAFAEEGESDVRAQASPYSASGAFVEGVRGRVRSLGGKQWKATAVISETHVYPWPGGASKQYRGGKHEAKHGFFRKTKSRLNRSRAVNRAELTKGLN